ncbi:MAG TPA: hypothetical protein PLU75_03700 [Oscillospiraceae bacterium]|nr:hypothetical protein [Oscillospiraceae bacterium]
MAQTVSLPEIAAGEQDMDGTRPGIRRSAAVLGRRFFSVFGLFAAVCIRGKVFFRLPKRKRPPRHTPGYSPLSRRLGATFFFGIRALRRGLHPWEGVFSSAKKKKAATAHVRVFAARPPSWHDVLRYLGASPRFASVGRCFFVRQKEKGRHGTRPGIRRSAAVLERRFAASRTF